MINSILNNILPTVCNFLEMRDGSFIPLSSSIPISTQVANADISIGSIQAIHIKQQGMTIPTLLQTTLPIPVHTRERIYTPEQRDILRRGITDGHG